MKDILTFALLVYKNMVVSEVPHPPPLVSMSVVGTKLDTKF